MKDTPNTPATPSKLASERAPVSVFLDADDAGGLKSAGIYTPGQRHDKVPPDIADRLVRRFKFRIVPADFAPQNKPAAAAASKEG